jgi:hypothetical protein
LRVVRRRVAVSGVGLRRRVWRRMLLRRAVLRCPVLRCPVLRCPVLRCPVLRCPVLRCPVLRWVPVRTGGMGRRVASRTRVLQPRLVERAGHVGLAFLCVTMDGCEGSSEVR